MHYNAGGAGMGGKTDYDKGRFVYNAFAVHIVRLCHHLKVMWRMQ